MICSRSRRKAGGILACRVIRSLDDLVDHAGAEGLIEGMQERRAGLYNLEAQLIEPGSVALLEPFDTLSQVLQLRGEGNFRGNIRPAIGAFRRFEFTHDEGLNKRGRRDPVNPRHLFHTHRDLLRNPDGVSSFEFFAHVTEPPGLFDVCDLRACSEKSGTYPWSAD